MDEVQFSVLYGALTVLAAIYFIRWRRNPVSAQTGSDLQLASSGCSYLRHGQLNSIPTLGGPSVPILSYLSAINYTLNSRKILREGYEKVGAIVLEGTAAHPHMSSSKSPMFPE